MAKTGTVYTVGAAGLLLIWSGVSNKGFLVSLRDLLQGVEPTAGTAQPFLSSGSGATDASSGSVQAVGGNPQSGTVKAQNQALGKSMAAAYGWNTGDEWTALNDVVMEESGWDANAANPISDARGIAQNINGWSSNYQAGNAAQQIAWMLAYIKKRYGDPIKAQQFHLANNSY
jgi:hypothetical protein